jgi:hypothetical protein
VSFQTSALVLAWVAIVLLALGLAGLLRQVQLLSRGRVGGADGPAATTAHTPRDLVGFRLPRQGPLAGLVDPVAHRTVLAFVSPGCPSCTQTLERLAATPDVAAGSVAVVAVSTGSCTPAETALAGTGRCVPRGRGLLERLRVPATPYLVAVDADGTLVAAVLPDEDTDVPGWVRHSRGSLSVTEEPHRE